MLRTYLYCAPLLVLAALGLGCGPKTADTIDDTTSTASSTTASTSASATEPTTDPTTGNDPNCDDRSVFCMVAPGFEDTTTSGGTTGPGEPMCESLLGELEASAQGLCSAGFAGIGLLDISESVGASNQCCYVYHCADPTQVCIPLAEAGACADEADLGDAAVAPQDACNSFIGSGIYPAPKGDFCCSDYQCYCGSTGG